MDGVVVDGAADRLPPPEGLDVPDHQLGLEGVWVVVVELGPLLVGHVAVGLVVVVVVEDAHVPLELGLEPFGQGGLAGAGPPGDADDHSVHYTSPPFPFCTSVRDIIPAPPGARKGLWRIPGKKGGAPLTIDRCPI